MWDNPRLLNLAANLLFGLAIALFGVAGLQMLVRSPLFPVREVDVQGKLEHALRADLEHAAAGLGGNFFALDLRAVRARFEQVPWVRHVDVRRVWPDRIEAKIEEHVALARWGDDALVNTHGERFVGRNEQALPLLLAPPGTEHEVARRYERFAGLVTPLGTSLERVIVTPRLAWQLRLGNGLNIMLGREADGGEERLRRFVAAYPETLGKIQRRHEYVDLRYPNGFALRVPELLPAVRG